MIPLHHQSCEKSSNVGIALVVGLFLIAFFFYYFSHGSRQEKREQVKRGRSVGSVCCSLCEDYSHHLTTSFSPFSLPASSVFSNVTGISSSAKMAISRKAVQVKSLPNILFQRRLISPKGSNSANVSAAVGDAIVEAPSFYCRTKRVSLLENLAEDDMCLDEK